jgi:RHH-type proline utilization regulon transcriptional repressor/proline dehydrogenase/delta 1-pyrroline-5-carboxylate dehydrogenase
MRAAEVLAARRGELIGVMIRDGGKTVAQADPEVSEAIDFANYYARSFDDVGTDFADVNYEPLGTVLVTPPWNFPAAIPAGGVLAALMAGNTVLFKPAPEATLTGWTITKALWDAGVPKDVLQFVPTSDDTVGRGLVTDERVDTVILTGAYQTARMFLDWKPDLRLLAETSGKNALIVTAMADRDQAIKDLVYSAFGHAGQKCSASSLGILEAEVYDDETFRRQLVDAARSWRVGPAADPTSAMTPVIREPDEKLHRALTTLESGESWLLEPQHLGGNTWTPGIKLGVRPGSFFHMTEVFGPVLGLMRAENLAHAVDLANAVDYGLTGGIHSLDDREVDYWQGHIHVGNAYANRGTTGAIVRRQPFGGWKRSAFGTAKAGGPNYTFGLGRWTDRDSVDLLEAASMSYPAAWASHFSKEHDPSGVHGEANIFRYVPLARMIIYADETTTEVDLERAQMAARTCAVPAVVVRDELALRSAMADGQYQYDQRVRVLASISEETRRGAHEVHVHLVEEPVVSEGRLELRHYLKEQSVTITTHRYGNIVR